MTHPGSPGSGKKLSGLSAVLLPFLPHRSLSTYKLGVRLHLLEGGAATEMIGNSSVPLSVSVWTHGAIIHSELPPTAA